MRFKRAIYTVYLLTVDTWLHDTHIITPDA